MQVEPPGQDVPDRRHPPTVGALRLSAAVGAAALAVASTGHLLLLGGLLALVAATRLGATTALLATTAVLVRWQAPSLSAVGGAQSVLGPAVVVGSTAAAASTVLAALAIALIAPLGRDRSWSLLVAVAVGVVAGAIAAGPALPTDIAVRLVGAGVTCGLAVGSSRLALRRTIGLAALGCASLALLLAAVA